jgi:uncharacterized protein
MEKLSTHTQIIEKINALLDRYHSDLSYCHGADHCRRVARLAVKIGEREGADCRIIEVAALLHDIGTVPLAWGRHASGRDDYDFQEFLGSYALPSANHGEVGALIAEQFLKQTGYPETKTGQVALIIREHNSRNQTTPESRIVSDADRLEALGATWVARAFQRTNAFDRRISIESIPQKYLEGRKSFLDDFHTESVKEIAIQRYRFLTDFIEQFQKEMNFEA